MSDKRLSGPTLSGPLVNVGCAFVSGGVAMWCLFQEAWIGFGANLVAASLNVSMAIYKNRTKEGTDGHRRDSEGDTGGADNGASPVHGFAASGSIGEPGEGVDPELVVPDSSEAIVGYRQWTETGGTLTGFGGETWWPWKEKLVARHAERMFGLYGRSERPNCDAPARGCSCGIYALNHPAPWQGVFGEVNLWGRVLQGSKGWRAQYAYPKRLWVSAPSFKPVENALAALDEVDERVREEVQAKLDETKAWYAEAYLKARWLAEQLRENYGVPVELHDPDAAHPLAELTLAEAEVS